MVTGFFAFALNNSLAWGQRDSVNAEYSVYDTIPSDFNLFGKDELLDMSLMFDITAYIRNKPKDRYLKAVLSYQINDTASISKTVRLKSRGYFRHRYCTFPPIKLNLKKTDFSYEDLNKLSVIKLVTHCRTSRSFEKYVLKEYLVYKLYNILTDYSFRVRLARIKYIDTGRKGKNYTQFGFLIEPDNLMASRTNSRITEAEKIPQTQIMPEHMDRVAIFNYMIGNTDWSLPIQHNMKVVIPMGRIATSQGIIVPYDFDFSGLVDTHYAIPHENFNIKSVRERLYIGICRDRQTFIKDLKEFENKKSEFYRIINDFEYLSDKAKKEMIDYLDTFFMGFDNRYSIVDDIMSECRRY